MPDAKLVERGLASREAEVEDKFGRIWTPSMMLRAGYDPLT